VQQQEGSTESVSRLPRTYEDAGRNNGGLEKRSSLSRLLSTSGLARSMNQLSTTRKLCAFRHAQPPSPSPWTYFFFPLLRVLR